MVILGIGQRQVQPESLSYVTLKMVPFPKCLCKQLSSTCRSSVCFRNHVDLLCSPETLVLLEPPALCQLLKTKIFCLVCQFPSLYR